MVNDLWKFGVSKILGNHYSWLLEFKNRQAKKGMMLYIGLVACIKKQNMNPSENLRRRSDLSPFLFHFTKDRNGDDAKSIIQEIIDEMKLKSDAGYICFTEQPLIMCDEMFSYFNRFPKPMYRPYGIGIRRDLLYRKGARNVIYGSLEEGESMPESMKWRFLEMDVDKYDFSWLREWRYPGNELDFSEFSSDDVIIVTPQKEDEVIAFSPDYAVDFDYDSDTNTSIPRLYACGASRAWRSINFDRVKKDKMNDYMVDASTFFEQRIGEDLDDWVN